MWPRMEYYVGLDVSLKQTSICVVDQTGAVVREGVGDSDPEAISVYVKSKAPDAVRVSTKEKHSIDRSSDHRQSADLLRAAVSGFKASFPRVGR